jgi:hypothetical protein
MRPSVQARKIRTSVKLAWIFCRFQSISDDVKAAGSNYRASHSFANRHSNLADNFPPSATIETETERPGRFSSRAFRVSSERQTGTLISTLESMTNK